MAPVMLGTLFLIKQKIQGRQQWPMLSFNDLVTERGAVMDRTLDALVVGDRVLIQNGLATEAPVAEQIFPI